MYKLLKYDKVLFEIVKVKWKACFLLVPSALFLFFLPSKLFWFSSFTLLRPQPVQFLSIPLYFSPSLFVLSKRSRELPLQYFMLFPHLCERQISLQNSWKLYHSIIVGRLKISFTSNCLWPQHKPYLLAWICHCMGKLCLTDGGFSYKHHKTISDRSHFSKKMFQLSRPG